MHPITPRVPGFRTSSSVSAPVLPEAPGNELGNAVVDEFTTAKAHANGSLAPPSYVIDGKTVVFGNILKVDSVIVLDVANKKSTVKAVVEFEISETGCPAIDLVPNATKVIVDGKEIDAASYAEVPDPSGASRFRIIGTELEPGKHSVEIEYELSAGVRYSGDSVEFFVSKSDLDDRQMDEQSFPTNLEYDQYSGSLSFEVRGTETKHCVMTNGEVSEHDGKLVVTYPAHFNTASLFLNVINPDKFVIIDDIYQGVNGDVPLRVYTPNNVSSEKEASSMGGDVSLKSLTLIFANEEPVSATATATRAAEIAKQALARLEKNFGAYPHPRLLVRVSGSGGMEYSGATESDLRALPHELHHQWFARSAQPANGNAGWIDEAHASWDDKGAPTATKQPDSPQKLSGFAPWHRITPIAAYSHGASVMAFLHGVFQPKGGLVPVMAKFFAEFKDEVFTTEMFLAHLKEQGEGLAFDFDEFFRAQVYGTGLAVAAKRRPGSSGATRHASPS
ncbi:MAG: hypothetical protein H7Z43_06440 [Clostridia bacterium]|nr:hypothetical protein [Deltaproteobacteria bacterium]